MGLNRYRNETELTQTWVDPVSGQEITVLPNSTVLADSNSAIARSRATSLVQVNASHYAASDANPDAVEGDKAALRGGSSQDKSAANVEGEKQKGDAPESQEVEETERASKVDADIQETTGDLGTTNQTERKTTRKVTPSKK